MTSVAAKMNGLKTEQTTEFYVMSNYPTGLTPTTAKQTAVVDSMVVCYPQFINETIIAGAGSDQKFYFRQEKLTGIMNNQSAGDVVIDLYYMSVRKNIVRSEFGSIDALLSDNGIAVNWWMTNVTAGNTAQRYLKFGKHKRFILRSGHSRKISLRSKKYNAPKMLTQDVEGNALYLGTKYFTKFLYMKANPLSQITTSSTAVQETPIAQSIVIQTLMSRYTSWYINGDNNPTAAYSKDFGAPTINADVHVWTDATPQPTTVPP